jgi:hypothetical protein
MFRGNQFKDDHMPWPSRICFAEDGSQNLAGSTADHHHPPTQPLFMISQCPARHQQLRKLDQEQSCQSLAWVVMPDHLHWLIELQSATLATLMRRFKSRSSLALHKAGVEQHPVWQAGYQDRALRRER